MQALYQTPPNSILSSWSPDPNDEEATLAINREWVARNHERFAFPAEEGALWWLSGEMCGLGLDVPTRRWVDIGCGTGCASQIMAGEYTGIDVIETAVSRAREAYPSRRFVTGDATELPFEDGSFDRAISIGTLQMLPPRALAKALGELSRVLELDGLAFLLWPNFRETGWMRHPIADGPWWFTYYSAEDVWSLAASCGLARLDEGTDGNQTWGCVRKEKSSRP